jgi:hypothetical protein
MVTNYRISFLVEGDLREVIDFDNRAIVLVDVDQVLLESRIAIQPPNITYE